MTEADVLRAQLDAQLQEQRAALAEVDDLASTTEQGQELEQVGRTEPDLSLAFKGRSASSCSCAVYADADPRGTAGGSRSCRTGVARLAAGGCVPGPAASPDYTPGRWERAVVRIRPYHACSEPCQAIEAVSTRRPVLLSVRFSRTGRDVISELQ